MIENIRSGNYTKNTSIFLSNVFKSLNNILEKCFNNEPTYLVRTEPTYFVRTEPTYLVRTEPTYLVRTIFSIETTDYKPAYTGAKFDFRIFITKFQYFVLLANEYIFVTPLR